MAGNKYDDDDAQGSIDARKVVAQSRILLMYANRAPWIASCTGGSGTMVICNMATVYSTDCILYCL